MIFKTKNDLVKNKSADVLILRLGQNLELSLSFLKYNFSRFEFFLFRRRLSVDSLETGGVPKGRIELNSFTHTYNRWDNGAIGGSSEDKSKKRVITQGD